MVPRQRVSVVAVPANIQEKPMLNEDAASTSSTETSSSTNSTEQQQLLQQQQQQQRAADVARQNHDIFNLFALIPVVVASLVNMNMGNIFRGLSLAYSWNGNHFALLWVVTTSYFIIDLCWVAKVPICVKSPGTIIKHHTFAVIYLIGPVLWPDYRWFVGLCLSVEVNTWFLILRRVLYKSPDRLANQDPQSWNFRAVLENVVSFCFYVSWIVTRCYVYPAVLYHMLRIAYEGILFTNVYFHWPMVIIPVHAFFVLLNLKWSYDLFWPLIKRTFLGNNGNSASSVSSGL